MKVVTVQLRKSFNTFLCETGGEHYRTGDVVVVQTSDGYELGKVICDALRRSADTYPKPKYKVVRLATEEDLAREDDDIKRGTEALKICKQRIEQLALPMKLLDVKFAAGGEKVTFFFTAENRVNFRELVKQLAAEFQARVELRQVGARNEAQEIGGVGCCGRPICCASFLPRFEPVTIRMAKDQGLSLEPSKISGLCGRLLCCLAFEAGTYAEQLKKMPKPGNRVTTSYGDGKVLKANVLAQSLVIDLEEGRRMTLPLADVKKKTRHEEEKKKGKPEESRNKAKVDNAKREEKPQQQKDHQSRNQQSRKRHK